MKHCSENGPRTYPPPLQGRIKVEGNPFYLPPPTPSPIKGEGGLLFSLFEGYIAVMKHYGINVVSIILLQGEKEGKNLIRFW